MSAGHHLRTLNSHGWQAQFESSGRSWAGGRHCNCNITLEEKGVGLQIPSCISITHTQIALHLSAPYFTYFNLDFASHSPEVQMKWPGASPPTSLLIPLPGVKSRRQPRRPLGLASKSTSLRRSRALGPDGGRLSTFRATWIARACFDCDRAARNLKRLR
jgi:hypothetical protein